MSNQNDNDKSERQIEALLKLSQDKSFKNSIQLSPKKDSGLINVEIDPSRVKKPVNWSRVGTIAAITVFILNIFIIQNPISINLSQQLSFFGLIIILFGSPLSKYKGTMWAWGRIGTRITEPSPTFLVKFIGWMMLLIPIIYELYSRLQF